MSDIDQEEYLEMRHELEAMTHSELVDEVINRMKFQQQIIIDNWNENKGLRKEVQESRDFIIKTADQIQKWEDGLEAIISKCLYWQRSFYLLLFLMIVTLIYSFIQT
ncbi:hypothetical protein [Acinetobacter gerneri]|uniref:hypothetical protein n=1 Tax=Acinetobacter gerneri TaxID=202952 RepID=UPI0028B1D794|nr:hypothetical protein [Acinetobacter gerneri]